MWKQQTNYVPCYRMPKALIHDATTLQEKPFRTGECVDSIKLIQLIQSNPGVRGEMTFGYHPPEMVFPYVR